MKFFSFNSSQLGVLSTLSAVILLGAFYMLIYLPGKEKVIQKQSFRSLQNIDRNIHAKVENTASMLNNFIKVYQNDTINKTTLDGYIKNYSKTNFFLLPIDSVADKKHTIKTDSLFKITVDSNIRQISLRLSQFANGNVYSMAIKYRFEQFIKPILPADVFDQYIVFSRGKVVYETFPSGLNAVNQDSLLGTKNGMGGAGIKDLTISGSDYKLFLQPVVFDSENEWVVAGLYANQRYQHEKKQLPSNSVLLLITVTIILIVSYPWIKIYQMGSQDRLTVFDGLMSLMVAMLLMSLLFFVFFKYNVSARLGSTPDSKRTLSSQISTAFVNEIKLAYKKLNGIDHLIKNHRELRTDILKLKSDDISYGNPYRSDELLKSQIIVPDSLTSNLRNLISGLRINQAFWLNNKGDEIYNWNNNAKNTPHGNFARRDYFKKAISNATYNLNDKSTDNFYLDQVISWTSGSFTTVITKKSELSTPSRPVVIALSFNMKSVQNVVLPLGYTFAIIENTGRVLYHSDSTRNLNENLIKEFTTTNTLVSTLEARSQNVFRTGYFGKDYAVNVAPINNLPYFIVVFSRVEFKEARDIEIYSFTILMLVLLFLFLIVVLSIVFFASAKRSVFKKQLFDTSWIGPKISGNKQYVIAAIFNGALIALLCAFFFRTTFVEYLLILLLSIVWVSVFLNLIFAKRYFKDNPDLYHFKLTSLKWMASVSAALNFAAFLILDHPFKRFVFFEVLILIISGVLYYFSEYIYQNLDDIRQNLRLKWKFTNSYALMALTRMIITSGVPVVFFYVSSYNYEQNLIVRYRQFDYANLLINKFSTKPELLKQLATKYTTQNAVYKDGSWIRDFSLADKIPAAVNYSKEELLTLSILRRFRVYQNQLAVSEHEFYLPQAGDASFAYNHLLKQACRADSSSITYKLTKVGGRYLQVNSMSLNYRIPVFSELNGWLFWLSLLISLVVFYFVIHDIVKKIFAVALPDINLWKAIDDEILKSSGLNNLVFIIGLPGSGKLFNLLQKIKENKLSNEESFKYDKNAPESNNVFVADFIHIPDSTIIQDPDWELMNEQVSDKKHRLVIINHFEYNIQSADTNHIKLNFLERLMLEDRCKIIILSTVHPTSFLDSISDSATDEKNKAIIRQDLERWHVLLGHYRIVIAPLEATNPTIYDTAIEKIIAKETQYTHFMKKMRDAALAVTGKMTSDVYIDDDSLAFKMQVSAHYFYMYIWQSLTKEEKFLLYDLAEDGLVNSFDSYNLNMLLSKGVIIRTDGMLRLFNRGFRNFILTAIGINELVQIKKKIQNNGNWTKLKTPMLVILIAILTFLFISQQETYSKLIAYAGALAGGIPALLKLFSVFNDNSIQKSNS